ncbi:hypothetical protein JNM87_00895 [Candidatus Saccharibacteria bacterium]|nr:hypothetical protein [Candidatus Saccharibacteria bacterium]
MRQKDIAVIIVIAVFSAVISFLLSNKLFVRPDSRQQKYEVVDVISTDFSLPDSRFFNSQSINPTPNTELGSNTNQNPFNSDNK